MLDEGDDVDVIYLDLKPLDKVHHRRLIAKLQGYGIKGKILDWTKEFLSRRKQRVINGSKSKWTYVTSGSVLGQILFLK